jgi:hypothetical protein
VLDERGDAVRGVVVERAEVGQVEPPAGLGRGRVAGTGGERPLAGGRVRAGPAEQPGAGDVDADQHEGGAEVHQLTDQVQCVLIISAMKLESRNVVD